ncbi:serine/threonine-protein kinase [Cellulomonas fimi]|uniref:non-specific serine/threonine protein kinase n=1 Tax=Cellulomonas fimi TaxID=1708 RepID=A0A7Y0LXZ9_CELFI|nr:serine/threonine-protein kinase [Cellulomonas fimi]NMR18817.1 serine/threonine protein kinase [Cellulomonas fimi]
MTSRREPSTPPDIPGYEARRLLGMGGFADVFLYQQQMPRRSVAVKVLLAGTLGPEVRSRFQTEADLMAQLSHHPSIVTIYQAAIAGDGRPYLVMEYCSRPGLGARYRSERISVAEALRIGIRLASAVETAHRAGILHRDIKPANVLITDFGWPALTDFGIAATTGWSSGSAVGMSIPWSPPELLAEDPQGDVRGDVYSLGATVYSLLARRSPFEVPGGANGAADLIARIERSPLAPTGRTDVPASLQAALARSMEKDPAHRHHSALAFARALQQVELELMLPGTPVELPEDVLTDAEQAGDADGGEAADQQLTRLRPVVSIDPDADPDADPADDGAQATRLRPVASISPDGAPARPASAVPSYALPAASAPSATAPDRSTQPRHRRRLVLGAVAGAVVVGVLVGAAALSLGGGDAPPEAEAEASPAPTATVAVTTAVPTPVDLVGTTGPDGAVVFTWGNPEPQDGDRYLWGVVQTGTQPRMEVVDERVVSVPGAGTAAPVCIEVSIVRADRRASTTPAVGCSP